MSGPQTQSFTYDALSRLTAAAVTGGPANYNESYSYNPTTGNLETKGGLTLAYNDGNHAHAVTEAGGNTYGYDLNGNQTTRVIGGSTYTLGYDAENRLVSVSGPSLSAQFTYDGDGRRVASTINGVTTVFAGNHYEVTGGAVTKYYFAGGNRAAMRKNGMLYYLLSDHLGSTSLTTDANGNKVAGLRYNAWGAVRYAEGATPTKYTYTGQFSYMTDFGLMFFNSRFYDPATGRFAQADTIVPGVGNPQSWDRYGYCLNNPIKYSDKSGHWSEDELEEYLGEGWRETYFGEDGIFQERDELLKFLLSKESTGLNILKVVTALFKVSLELNRAGVEFTNYDAIGSRISFTGGADGMVGISFDAILNLTSGEFSAFISPEGGVMLGATAVIVGGVTLIKNMPTNSSYRGVAKSVGGAAGKVIGANIEGFYGPASTNQPINGLYIGIGGTIPYPNAGGYGSLSYAFEVLNVNESGNSWVPYLPTPTDVFHDIGSVLWNDILGLP